MLKDIFGKHQQQPACKEFQIAYAVWQVLFFGSTDLIIDTASSFYGMIPEFNIEASIYITKNKTLIK